MAIEPWVPAAFATLINLLEAYRLDQLKKQAVEKEAAVIVGNNGFIVGANPAKL